MIGQETMIHQNTFLDILIGTKLKKIQHMYIEKSKAWEFANTRKGYWRISNSPIMCRSLKNDVLKKLRYLFFSDYYNHVNS